jgi:hypothetical protein
MGMTERVDVTQHGQEQGAILVIRSHPISDSELVGCQPCAFIGPSFSLTQRDKSMTARCCLAASFSNGSETHCWSGSLLASSSSVRAGSPLGHLQEECAREMSGPAWIQLLAVARKPLPPPSSFDSNNSNHLEQAGVCHSQWHPCPVMLM